MTFIGMPDWTKQADGWHAIYGEYTRKSNSFFVSYSSII